MCAYCASTGRALPCVHAPTVATVGVHVWLSLGVCLYFIGPCFCLQAIPRHSSSISRSKHIAIPPPSRSFAFCGFCYLADGGLRIQNGKFWKETIHRFLMTFIAGRCCNCPLLLLAIVVHVLLGLICNLSFIIGISEQEKRKRKKPQHMRGSGLPMVWGTHWGS